MDNTVRNALHSRILSGHAHELNQFQFHSSVACLFREHPFSVGEKSFLWVENQESYTAQNTLESAGVRHVHVWWQVAHAHA